MLSSAVRLDNVNKVIKLEKMVLLDITNYNTETSSVQKDKICINTNLP